MKEPVKRKLKFTKASVEKLAIPAGETDFAYYDETMTGFGIRFREGGTVGTYFIKYKIGKKYRRVQLGRSDQVTLASAQKEAEQLRAQVSKKVDPANDRAKKVTAAGITFNPTYDGWLEKLERERSKSYHDANKNYMEKHFIKLHGLALASIEQDTVSRVLKTINDVRGPIAMNRARSAGSAFFNWARGEGLCKHNPFEWTNKNEEDEDGRERTLAAKELKAIWTKLQDDDDYGDILKLLALTTARRTEIGSLRRHTEINWKERLIELPGKVKVNGRWVRRTKNGRPHVIPLVDEAFAILEKRKEGKGEFIFGRYDGPFSGWSKSKAELDEVVKIAHWTLHDLRRTGDTVISEEFGVPPHIVDAIMNHVSTPTSAKKGIRKKYNKAQYLKEKRDALDQYAAWLMKVVN